MAITMEKLKHIFMKYRHGIPLLVYMVIYLSWFGYLERTVTKHYKVIHMDLDDYIPFCEIFVIPYFLWFAYVAIEVMYFFFKNKDSYYKTCIFLFTGMTVFLAISTLWPNGHHLRPMIMPRDNIFTQLIEGLYKTDTATNLWPSIHVYNSIGAHLAIARSKEFENRPVIRRGSLILCVSIILSTMLIKQHSVFDVLTAFVMAAAMYMLVYRFDLVATFREIRSRRKVNPQTGW